MKHFVLGIQELTQIEQDRRTFLEGIDRAQRALDQALALISSAQVAGSWIDTEDAGKPSALNFGQGAGRKEAAGNFLHGTSSRRVSGSRS
jgi:hypothetical protein